MRGRITFPGSPWPQGHALVECVLEATLHPEHGVRLQVHLTTEDYDTHPPRTEGRTDWTSPRVWANYEGAMLSSTAWGWDQWSGFPVTEMFDPTDLSGSYAVDTIVGDDIRVIEDPAFRIYLLGHDAVCDHALRLTATDEPGAHAMHWTGRIALTYAGDRSPEHRFEATADGLVLDTLRLLGGPESVDEVRVALRRHTVRDDVWRLDAESVRRRALVRSA